MQKDIFKKKTTWGGIVTIITAVGMYITGDIDIGTAFQTVAGSLIAIFLRDGMSKGD